MQTPHDPRTPARMALAISFNQAIDAVEAITIVDDASLDVRLAAANEAVQAVGHSVRHYLKASKVYWRSDNPEPVRQRKMKLLHVDKALLRLKLTDSRRIDKSKAQMAESKLVLLEQTYRIIEECAGQGREVPRYCEETLQYLREHAPL